MTADTAIHTLIDRAFSTESLRVLARAGQTRRYRKNAILIHEGATDSSIVLIVTGQLRAYSTNDAGQEFVHGIYSAGDYVGEMSLDGHPRSANVKALENSVCVVVQRDQILSHISAYPEFAMDLLNRVIGRARVATRHARALALSDSYGRITQLLNELARDGDNGERQIPERLTHREIASRVGTSREMVSKILKDLVAGGFITVDNRRILIQRRLPPGW